MFHHFPVSKGKKRTPVRPCRFGKGEGAGPKRGGGQRGGAAANRKKEAKKFPLQSFHQFHADSSGRKVLPVRRRRRRRRLLVLLAMAVKSNKFLGTLMVLLGLLLIVVQVTTRKKQQQQQRQQQQQQNGLFDWMHRREEFRVLLLPSDGLLVSIRSSFFTFDLNWNDSGLPSWKKKRTATCCCCRCCWLWKRADLQLRLSS